MAAADGEGAPIGLVVTSATPHRARLIEQTLYAARIPRKGAGRPRKYFKRLTYDGAADSKTLRERLKKKRDIDLICPRRKNNKHKTRDGRKLRRYKRRWKIERTNARLHNYRRIVVRYDRFLSIYRAFVPLAFIMIVLKKGYEITSIQ